MTLVLALAVASAIYGAPVRFHHLHYRVGDPAAAMADAAAMLKGTRTIVPGLGVGVRTGDTYVLFDRRDDDESDESDAGTPRLHHVAFAAADFDAVVTRLAAVHPVLARGTESVLFDAGLIRLEIVRESGGPDAFWCPMHPDVRTPGPGRCPLCAMELVPIPPPRIGEYKLDVALERGSRSGLAGLRLTVRDPETNSKVTDFARVHDKVFHLFIVSRDLASFAHVHPEQGPDGSFALKHRLPPGEFMLFADFLPKGGSAQMVQRAILSPGIAPPDSGAVQGAAMSPAAIVEGIRFALVAADVRAGRHASLTFTLSDVNTGAAVVDLEPFLGAPAHMLLVRGDLGDAIHGHPEETGTSGPAVTFHPLIPADGAYKLWIQVRRGGRVITAPFWLTAGR